MDARQTEVPGRRPGEVAVRPCWALGEVVVEVHR